MIDDMPEEWRPIPGLADHEASSLGRIRSHKRGRTKIMSAYTDKLGYARLTCAGQRVLVHRAVAAAFHGPCPEGKETDHINEVRNDNRPENLRYLTRQENMARMTAKIALTTECSKGHPMIGANLYIRPSSGRRECRACTVYRLKNRPSSGLVCSEADCTRVADCRLRTDHPICEKHYQRSRRMRNATPSPELNR